MGSTPDNEKRDFERVLKGSCGENFKKGRTPAAGGGGGGGTRDFRCKKGENGGWIGGDGTPVVRGAEKWNAGLRKGTVRKEEESA